jgi:hypothetical protein
MPATTWPVPGVALAAWSGPGDASLVVYRSLPVPGGQSADRLAEGLANRLSNLPDLRVIARRTEPIGGALAARVEVVAPGTGDALVPSGTGTPIAPEGKPLRPTRRVMLGVVRPSDTLWLVWHAPESTAETLEIAVQTSLKTLRIAGGRSSPRSY